MLSRVGGLGVGVKVPELVSLPPASPLGSTLPSQGRFCFWVIYRNFIALFTVSHCLWNNHGCLF